MVKKCKFYARKRIVFAYLQIYICFLEVELNQIEQIK